MARARAALKRETRRKGKKTANGMEGEGKGEGERVWAEQAHRHAEGTSGGSRPLCIPNSNQLIGCWLEIELDRNVRVCVAVARRRKGKRVRERVCNKGDREGAEGCQRGRRGASGWFKREGNGRGSGASVFAMRPEYQCQPLFVATAVGRKRFSFSFSLLRRARFSLFSRRGGDGADSSRAWTAAFHASDLLDSVLGIAAVSVVCSCTDLHRLAGKPRRISIRSRCASFTAGRRDRG